MFVIVLPCALAVPFVALVVSLALPLSLTLLAPLCESIDLHGDWRGVGARYAGDKVNEVHLLEE